MNRIPTNTMNLQTEVVKLIERSNKEYLYHFVEYANVQLSKLNVPNKTACLAVIKELHSTFIEQKIEQNLCQYMVRRGLVTGRICNTIIKDDQQYCTKHRTNFTIPESEFISDTNTILSEEEEEAPVISDDNDDIVEDVAVYSDYSEDDI